MIELIYPCEQAIIEGKLLQAHQSLGDLENSRDDLLFELHRLGHQGSYDQASINLLLF